MIDTLRYYRGAWLVLGVFVGLALGGLLPIWPETPLHAVATDRYENFAIATGAVDNDVEAIYFLDFLSGELMAAVLSNQSGKFIAFYRQNVVQDLGIDVSKNPRYLMVTGIANLIRGQARYRPAPSVVYIAELTTGRVAAYNVPWEPNLHRRNQVFMGNFVLLDVSQFRNLAIREQE